MPRRRALLLSTAAVAASAVVVGLAPVAHAADFPVTPTPVSQAHGFFLSGAVGGTDLATVAELDDALAVNTGGDPVVAANPLGATVLGQLAVPIGQQTIPLGSGITFGALNQYAAANPDGSAVASSGAVADNGAVQSESAAGTAGDASIDLAAAATGSGLSQLADLGTLTLGAGALAGTATRASFGIDGSPGDVGGSYQIGSLTLALQSDALSGVLTEVLGAVDDIRDQLQAAIDTFEASTPPGVPGLAEISVDGELPDFSGLTSDLTSISGDGYSADLVAGTLTLDIARIVEIATGSDIDGLPANTDLVPLLVQAIPGIVSAIVDQIATQLDAKAEALAADAGGLTVSVTLLGQPVEIPLNGETLLEALPADFGDLSDQLDGAIGTALSSGLGEALGSLGSGLAMLLSLVANGQSTADDGTFTETALAVGLLPSASAGLPTALALNLGSAAVGPGTPLAPTPTANPTPGAEIPVLAATGAETIGGVALGGWALVAGLALLVAAGGAVHQRRRHPEGPWTL